MAERDTPGSRSTRGLLAEPERLCVVAALVLGARTPSELIDATGLDQRAVGRALQRLESGGLITAAADGFTAGGTVDRLSLRRSLVDEGLLTREDGQYWRSGGWVDVLGGG